MRIPDTCIKDAGRYEQMLSAGGLNAKGEVEFRRGGKRVLDEVRLVDLPHGAFGRLVRDKIDPLWGARDGDPDGYQLLLEQVTELREQSEFTEAEELLVNRFDPRSVANCVARAVYDRNAEQYPNQPLCGTLGDLSEMVESNPGFEDLADEDDEDDEAGTPPASAADLAAIVEAVRQAPPAPEPATPIRPTQASPAPAQPAPTTPVPAAISQPKGNAPMQFTVDKGPLLAALKRAVSVAGKKTTMPIIECVLLDVAGSILTLSATDLAVDMQIKVPVAMDARPGRLAVPGAALVTAIDALPDGSQATLEKTDDARLRIMAGRTRFHVPTMHPDDFPAFAMVDGSEIRVQAQELKRAIDRVAFGISTDDVARPQLAGMFLHARPDGLRVVGANGQILSRSDLATTAPATEFVQAFSEPGRPQGVMIPRDSVTALRRLLDAVDGEAEVTTTIGRKRAIFEMFPLRFGTTLSAAEYIAYEAVLSQTLATAKRNWTVPRAGLLATVRRVRALAGDKGRTVALTVTGDGVRAETTVRESATDAVDILEAPTGLCDAPIDIGFAAGHLAAALDSLNAGTVTCTMTDHLLPTFWRAEQEGDILAAEHLVVVMPFRLDPKKAEA
ncbi:DNA polymerase III subunit beta [Azospirillum sp. A26]|uniref:DNA polymerase III subunit beta n=1 Tax=Azospirillum sp. A26 TaxID=3160607 RepID=UPI00366E8E93